jgi:hypothetical protein
MSLQNDLELANTRDKLRELEEAYGAALRRPIVNEHTREATLTSLRHLINQLKEEVVRYEAHQPVEP